MSALQKRILPVVVLFAVTLGVQPVIGDLLGQIDTFDSDIAGWTSGANPTHIATGGAGGGFLQVSRDSSYVFHIAAYNKLQWQGDYASAGVTGIKMHLNAITGPDALNVRLMIWGDGGTWASTGVTPVASGWNSYTFGLTAADLVFVNNDVDGPAGSGGGTGILDDTLANLNIIQLRHDYASPTAPGSHPQHVEATLGIDNFEAIPEPATLLYMLIAGSGLFMIRRGNSRRRR